MTGSDAIQLAIAIPTVSVFLWGLMRVTVKIADVVKEMKPNGGNSLRDINDQQVMMLRLYLEKEERHHKETKEWMQTHHQANEESFNELTRRLEVIEQNTNDVKCEQGLIRSESKCSLMHGKVKTEHT